MKNRNMNLALSSPGRQTVLASEFRLQGRNERLIGSNGELNAGSTKELLQAIASLMHATKEGTEVITETAATQRAELANKRRELVLAAFESPEDARQLGIEIANELYISANKEGFMRRLFQRQEVAQGNIPQAQLRMKNVMAVKASGPVRTETQFVRDNWMFPPEFYLTARPFIEKRDIDRTNTDILGEKYIEALESIMVAEDRLWRAMALQAVGVANEATTIVGDLTAMGLASIRTLVNRWRIPVTNCLIASDIWNDIIGDSTFQNVIDPVSKHELLLQGELGRIFGMTLTTDAFRHQTQYVLNQGEIFAVGAPENHGQYTDRGGIESQPIDGTNENIPGRGWFMSESMSMVLANARSVAYAVRT
jgi:hypothetical protein